MKVVIYGCGQVGLRIAEVLSQDGHEVTVIDRDADSFRKLEVTGTNCRLVVGDAIDQDVLRKAEIEQADVFLALTGEDNANLFAAQVAQHIFNLKRVIARVSDEKRAKAFRELGLVTVCATDLIVDALKEHVGLGVPTGKASGRKAR